MLGAVKLADNRDLLGTGGEDLAAARARFAAELDDAVRRVGLIRRQSLAGLLA